MTDFNKLLLKHRAKSTMATKNPVINIEDDATLNIPTNNTQEVNEYTSSDSENNEPPRSSRRLVDVIFDDETAEYERRRLINPTGDWQKTEEWSFDEEKNIRVNPDDRQDHDIDPSGRTSYTVYGYPDERVDKEGNEYKPFLRLTFSPDKRMHKNPDKQGEVDFLYKLFLACRDVFVDIYGRKPKAAELLQCLCNDSYVINTMNGDDGPFVLRVKPNKKQR